MSQQHTQEPWSVSDFGDGLHGGGIPICQFYDRFEDDFPNREANARRIVACVNACAGVDVAWIESMAKAGGFAAMNQYIAAYNQAAAAINAEKQRDELLVSIDQARLLLTSCTHGERKAERVLNAAIASVKGGA